MYINTTIYESGVEKHTMQAVGDIKILVVEDELIIAEDIRTKLNQLGYTVTGIAISAAEAEQLLTEQKPDLVLLDIMLQGKHDGILLAQSIQDKFKIPYIFLTSYSDRQTIEQAKKVFPDGYLLKPFTDKDLFAAIEVAIFKKNAQNKPETDYLELPNHVLHDCIFIKKENLLVKIKFDDLLWMEADGNYLELHCAGSKKHLIRSTLRNFLAKLPADNFMQVHKSFAVNIKNIDAIEYSQITIANQKIPVGRTYVEKIKAILGIDI